MFSVIETLRSGYENQSQSCSITPRVPKMLTSHQRFLQCEQRLLRAVNVQTCSWLTGLACGSLVLPAVRTGLPAESSAVWHSWPPRWWKSGPWALPDHLVAAQLMYNPCQAGKANLAPAGVTAVTTPISEEVAS